VALRWLWSGYPLAINTLRGGFEVALGGFETLAAKAPGGAVSWLYGGLRAALPGLSRVKVGGLRIPYPPKAFRIQHTAENLVGFLPSAAII
jgi:hypothetical protein